MNKSKVLEIEDKYSLGMSFICKNDIYSKIDFNYMKLFIEILNKNNIIKDILRNLIITIL